MIFLSPGLDVAAAVEVLGRRLGYTMENGKYCVVSLGQVRYFCPHPVVTKERDPVQHVLIPFVVHSEA